jgi:hypothetical protein
LNNRTNNSGSNGDASVPEARAALNSMKMEIANELGIDLKQGRKGDVPSRVAGQMVRRMIELQEKEMGSKAK